MDMTDRFAGLDLLYHARFLWRVMAGSQSWGNQHLSRTVHFLSNSGLASSVMDVLWIDTYTIIV